MTTPSVRDEEWSASARGVTLKGLLALPVFACLTLFHLVSPVWMRWKDKDEARAELRRLVAEQERLSYETLRALVDHHRHIEFTAPAGTWYQATVDVMWDDEPDRTIRVAVSLDDGGMSAYHPMSDSILVEPPEASAEPR